MFSLMGEVGVGLDDVAARRRGRQRSRTVRALRGYLPNSPSTTEFPLCAQPGSTPQAGASHDAAVDEKSGKRTTPPTDRARDGCAALPSSEAALAAWTPSPRDDEMPI